MTEIVHQCSQNPLPAPGTVTVTETTSEWDEGEVEVTIAGDEADESRVVTIQVAAPGYWLLYCWFIDGNSITESETLTPPATPGVSHLFKVTDSAGLCSFTIENPLGWQGRVCCAVMGRVVVSDVMVVGV